MVVESPRKTEAPTQTAPQRSGGWFTRAVERVKLAFAGDDEELLVMNETQATWRVYHNYHQLGIIDTGERRVYHLTKRGSFSARPMEDGDDVEYLVITLDARVRRIEIYRKRMGKDLEVYDLRAA